MATGEAALLAGNKQENSGCVLAFFRIFRGKCSHLGLCSGSSGILSNKIKCSLWPVHGLLSFFRKDGSK